MEFSPAPPATSVGGLPQPPSAKSSRTFGILGICSHLLCLLGAPFAILFGILALVRHGRAKREHAADPRSFAPPTASGLVTGIVALAMLVVVVPMTGIVSAIAIPALLGQRERARIHAVSSMMHNVSGALTRTGIEMQARAPGRPVQAHDVVTAVLGMPSYKYPLAKNPYGGTETPYCMGDEPTTAGEVTLKPVEQTQDSEFTYHAGVVIRGQYRRNGAPVVVSKFVSLD